MRIRSSSRLALVSGVILLSAAVCAKDWPQYRGPDGNGISSETIAEGIGPDLKPLWKVPLQDGFSSMTVADGLVCTMVTREMEGVNREVCVALEERSGKERWAATIGIAKYDGGGDSGTAENKGGDGPRSTPSIDRGRVYVLDNRLVLACLDAKDGKPIWTKDLVKEHDAKLISWQNAASPLIEGGLVFVMGGGPGQALLGIDKETGKTVWKAEDDKITHATPIAATILGVRQVIFSTQKGLVSVLPQSGEVLWRHRFPYNVSTAASPVVWEDIVYCSAGYNVGAGAAKISKQGAGFSATEIWRTKGNALANHWSTPVCRDGYLYGMFSFKQYGHGPFKCVEIATGKEMWAQTGFGPGNVILVGNRLCALGDQGQVVFVDPAPANYRETGRFQALTGKCWSTPAFSNGRLLIRSTKEGAAYSFSETEKAREAKLSR